MSEPPEFLGEDLIPIDDICRQQPRYKGWIRKIKRVTKAPKNLSRKIKWKWQKLTRGWSDKDAWNLDYFYADLITRSLSEYKENRMGSPALPKRDENGEIIRNEEGIPEMVDNPHEVWDEKLEKMIWAFKRAREVAKGDLHFDNPKMYPEERWEELYESSIDIFGEENVMTREEIKRMKKGMDLFTKHFFALWD